MYKLVYLLLVLYTLQHLCLSLENLPEVDTPLGKVRGVWKTSVNGRKYAAFEGIPYAKPPIGDLRFEEPQPVLPWSGTWEANTLHTCLQAGIIGSTEISGEEDCLYLNIYLPIELVHSPTKVDVIVVIHGGAFMMGSGHMMTRSEVFMDRDVVLVSINYRVGFFGFLSTEDAAIPGNNGMKDQVLALQWARDNIASFGGNPHSVSIVGVSAGGASVHFHYLSPLSKGLFQKGLSQSGTALAPWALRRSPLENARKLAVSVGCPDRPTEELKRCLKQRPGQNLMKQLKHFYGYGILPLAPFAPVVEKGSRKPFLDKEPYWLLKEGNVLDVPWITSHTADEGLLPAAMYYEELDKVDKLWNEISVYFLDCNYTLPESRKNVVSREILDYYLGPGEEISKQNFKKFTQIFTDRLFAVPGELAAKMQAKVTRSPVYYYFFNYREGENKVVNFYTSSPEIEGVAHGEDGIYFYGLFAAKLLSDKDTRLSNACLNMLYSFFTTGKPSFDGIDWQPTGPSELTYLNITGPEDMKLQKINNLAPIDFWSKLRLLENEHVVVKDEL